MYNVKRDNAVGVKVKDKVVEANFRNGRFVIHLHIRKLTKLNLN